MARRKRKGIQRRSSDAPYNADYFAQKHDISIDQARELMRRIGRDPDKLNEAASSFSVSSPRHERLFEDAILQSAAFLAPNRLWQTGKHSQRFGSRSIS